MLPAIGLTLGAPIHKRLQTLHVVHVHHFAEFVVDPAAGFNAVEPANHNVELHVIIVVLVLNLATIGRDGDAANALLDEPSSYLGFWLTDIALSEEELTVEVGNINSIWV